MSASLAGACPGDLSLARLADEGVGGGRRAVADHVAGCARCRRVLAEFQSLAGQLAADPVAPLVGGEPDLAPLVLLAAQRPAPRRPWFPAAMVSAGMAACLCAGIFVERQRAATAVVAVADERGFQARGAASDEPAERALDRWVALRPFVVEDRAAPRALAAAPGVGRPSAPGRVPCGARLLFGYDNGGPRPFHRVAIVGSDESGRAEWFFPDGSGESGTVAAEAGVARELHEEVGLSDRWQAGGRLRVVALFTDEPLGREEVERALRAAPAGRIPVAGSGQHAAVLDVERCAAGRVR